MDNLKKNDEVNCKECKQKFKDKNELEIHMWKNHPKDKYQIKWSNTDFSSYNGSSFYRDDPYY